MKNLNANLNVNSTAHKWLKLAQTACSAGVFSLSVALSSATVVFASEQFNERPQVVSETVEQLVADPSQSNGIVNRVNINLANFEQLVSLPGIGKVKATAIMDYRKSVGPFNSTADIQNIKGIGSKLYAKLSELIEI